MWVRRENTTATGGRGGNAAENTMAFFNFANMKHLYLPALVLLLACPTFAQPAQPDSSRESYSLAITIDDLPAVTQQRSLENFQEITRKILTTLQHEKAPAIGFVNESKLYDNGQLLPGRLALLEQWLDAGLDLGNHTFGHPDYHRISFEEFSADLLAGEEHTRALLRSRNRVLRYFRHPFLHTGNSPEKKRQLAEFLRSRSYLVAPVTIDNAEYIFARAYDQARINGDSATMRRVGEAYIPYMEAKTAFYEANSRALFGRNIAHTLLIHANNLNADYLGALLAMYRHRGYHFVRLAEALVDEAYQSADAYTGNGGITWLHRWAITRKVDKSFFAGEPACPEFVMELAGMRE